MTHLITKALNLNARIYDRWARNNLAEVYTKIVELAGLKGGEKALDIGCGPGNLDLMLAELLAEGEVCAIDIAPKMIEVATRKAKKQGYDTDYKVGSSISLPYQDEEFDVAFTCLIYHHLTYKEKEDSLREIYRVLKPDGKYISCEFGAFPQDIFHRAFLRFSKDSGVLHGLYPGALIEQSGFEIGREMEGPSLLKHHRTRYRILCRPKILQRVIPKEGD
jgi:ubiquinone/menaquinone biosynthesis C-methylase UbiE